MKFTKPQEINDLMKDYKYTWFIAGGWAIDLFINSVTREHNDIEIGIFREEQYEMYKYFKDWTLKKVVKYENKPKLEVWKENEYLCLPVHEIHGHNSNLNVNNIEILLNEKHEDYWIYRRNQNIKRNIQDTILISELGIPILSPEIVLLYKSSHNKEKDNKDFMSVIDKLSCSQKNWLRESLVVTNPNHEWLDMMR